MIDLHTHSNASDGTFSPSDLINYAKGKKVTVLALTDHDTVDGLQEAQEAALSVGITFVPGIEINIAWPTGEFHLLGLGLRYVSPELNDIIQFLKEGRQQRNKQMLQKLRGSGVDINLEEVAALAQTKTIGRPHFAQLMVEKGIVKTRQQAFDLYFAKGRPCYVEREGADLAEAVSAIKASGGLPVQAHPLSMYVSWSKMEEAITEIYSNGVAGLEAWHPGARISEAERLEELARKFGMFVTAGSDFHGEQVRADRHLGFTAGKFKISERFWEQELRPQLIQAHGGEDLRFTASL